MTDDVLKIRVRASHDTYLHLLRDVTQRPDVTTETVPEGVPSTPEDLAPGVAQVVLDYPLTWALTQLEGLNSVDRARTLVVTQTHHPVYHDVLASAHVSGVTVGSDRRGVIAGLYAAATAQRTSQYRSPLTMMELAVVRLLLLGQDTKGVAEALDVTFKTINAHVSNVLGKLGLEGRSQLVADLLGHGAVMSSDAGRSRAIARALRAAAIPA